MHRLLFGARIMVAGVPRLDDLSSRRRRLAGTIDDGADLRTWFTGGLNESDY
jgi:hypothetical protein